MSTRHVQQPGGNAHAASGAAHTSLERQCDAGFGAQGPLSSANAAAAANTGAGGPGGVGGDDSAPAGQIGTNGGGSEGGGGGGGAVGVILVRGSMTCMRNGGVLSGAKPMTFNCP